MINLNQPNINTNNSSSSFGGKVECKNQVNSSIQSQLSQIKLKEKVNEKLNELKEEKPSSSENHPFKVSYLLIQFVCPIVLLLY